MDIGTTKFKTFECPQCGQQKPVLILVCHNFPPIGFLCFDCRQVLMKRLDQLFFPKKVLWKQNIYSHSS